MNIIIAGPRGKMGSLITKIASNRTDMKIVAGIGPEGRDYIGQDIGIVSGMGRALNAIVVDDIKTVINESDVIIDYTTTEFSMEILEAALRSKKAVVCGTTGFSEEEFNRIKDASKQIPIVYAANSSRVVNLMYKLLKIAAEAIGNVSDIEIIEMHDRYKKDAPSGTSKEMGQVIAEALNKELKDIAVFGREGKGERVPGSIGYHSIRSGDISSSHTVMFGLMGERLEITHHAYNWECFAQGACEAAAFLYGKEPGLYTIKDVLKIE
ncbi:4-hydroxy-tetrahydrodipicolinate reductase [Lutispora thermophila]|uniref:4-hydroxy-tetrahydrodipicolinate reductase n=1 Tax=Lutispora thermophila DSM 19022 TaxID=1122184 RepID=A0A1M6GU76_9FIRM|nr:4-hydroxy-tetrahydrodipicolinate reductase [Lutispora thermophila]SHJ13400.1 dihydrodipicolinate reductase [Lutispora thermophila DSM 19022]